MSKFRIPRKIKKKLKNKFLFYPSDKDGNSIMAFPLKSQKDYTAYKLGLLEDTFSKTKKERKKSSKEWNKKFSVDNDMSFSEIEKAVNNIFAEEFREEALKVLKRAKGDIKYNNKIKDHWIVFCNAWDLVKAGDKHSITACMAYDSILDEYNLL